MLGRKGLSDVISVVLIIILVVAAVGLIWGFVAPIVKNIQVNKAICSSAPVEVVSCQKSNMSTGYRYANGFNVGYRYSLESVEGIKEVKSSNIILKMEDGGSIPVEDIWAITSETRIASFITPKNAKEATIVSTFVLDDGSEQTCDIPAKVCNNEIKGITDLSEIFAMQDGNIQSGSHRHPVGVGDGINPDIWRYPELTSEISTDYISGQTLNFIYQDLKHSVTLNELTATQATIIVQSTPQTATLNIGETKYFDLNSDGAYDLSIKLNSIDGENARITVALVSFDIRNKLVIYYSFDQGIDQGYKIIDQMENYNGSVPNGYPVINVTDPIRGSVAKFNYSTHGMIDVNWNALRGQNASSLSIWFKNLKGQSALFWNEIYISPRLQEYRNIIYSDSLGYLRGAFFNEERREINSGVNVSDGAWHNVILVANITQQIMYIDGTNVGEVDCTVNNTRIRYLSSNNTMRIGFGYGNALDNSYNGWSYYDGYIDDFRIYKKALSAEEVVDLYNQDKIKPIVPPAIPEE